jgi:spermidine/putrescine transport system ATP-binding protein
MSQDVQLDRVTMRFGKVTAVRGVSLTIRAGEFFSFLGPSGCGKTTILRLISGFIEPSEGVVRIGGRDMRGIGPNRRPTALIFQNLALFPLMTVAENIGFGLEVRGVRAAERRRRVDALLELVALPDAGNKKVSELSGGQRQRIAIARALAVEPSVLLLDEPLSALDLKLRQHMRAELRAIQRRTGVTFVYITHDQGEALTMSDRIGVMSGGVLEQVGDSRSLYDAPETAFVASFVGENNRFPGTVVRAADGMAVLDTPLGRLVGRNPRGIGEGERAILFVRPERLVPAGPDAVNLVVSRVTHQDFEGAFVNTFLEGAGSGPIVVQTPHTGAPPLVPAEGPARLAFDAADAIVLPAGGPADERA